MIGPELSGLSRMLLFGREVVLRYVMLWFAVGLRLLLWCGLTLTNIFTKITFLVPPGLKKTLRTLLKLNVKPRSQLTLVLLRHSQKPHLAPLTY